MSVSNGQKADEETFNTAFPSKVIDDEIPSKWDLTNIDPNSGDQVINFQKAINEASSKNYGLQVIAANGQININNVKGTQNRLIQSSIGDEVISLTPFGIVGGWTDGTEIRLVGGHNLNRCIINHNDNDYGAILNGNMTLGLYNAITLVWFENLKRWIEIIPRNS